LTSDLDPVNRVGDVACAVGYADSNYLRDVFKTRVGMASRPLLGERLPGPSSAGKPASADRTQTGTFGAGFASKSKESGAFPKNSPLCEFR